MTLPSVPEHTCFLLLHLIRLRCTPIITRPASTIQPRLSHSQQYSLQTRTRCYSCVTLVPASHAAGLTGFAYTVTIHPTSSPDQGVRIRGFQHAPLGPSIPHCCSSAAHLGLVNILADRGSPTCNKGYHLRRSFFSQCLSEQSSIPCFAHQGQTNRCAICPRACSAQLLFTPSSPLLSSALAHDCSSRPALTPADISALSSRSQRKEEDSHCLAAHGVHHRRRRPLAGQLRPRRERPTIQRLLGRPRSERLSLRHGRVPALEDPGAQSRRDTQPLEAAQQPATASASIPAARRRTSSCRVRAWI